MPSPRSFAILIPLVVSLCLCPLIAGVPLQQGSLSKAGTLIKNAEADIKSAAGSAGTAARPAKGSRLKLTVMRLKSAQTRLAKAAEMLSKGAGDKRASATKERYQRAMLAVAEIEAVIRPAAPKPPLAKPTAPAAETGSGGAGKGSALPLKTKPAATRLDYKQEKLLKDARWYLRETDKYGGVASQLVARLDGTGPKPVHREVKHALASIELAIPKYNLATENISKLPASHPDVAELRGKIQQAGNILSALRSRLQAVSGELQKLTGMDSYPKYKQDYELLSGLSGRYGNFKQEVQSSEKLARIIREDGAALAEFRRVSKLYLPLVEQQTKAGEAMEKRVNYALRRRTEFVAQALIYRKALPAAITADIAAAEKLSEEAVSKNKPGWFGENSGIAQRLAWAEDKLLVLRAFSQAEAKPQALKIAAARQRIRASAKLLSAEIIAGNFLPSDAYRGKDRKALIKLAIDTWKSKQGDAVVLGIRVPSQSWSRSTRWQVSRAGFYKVDASTLQIQLLIEHDAKLAAIRPINLYMNHLAGDRITASPFHALSDELQPHSLLLREKIK